jgi:EAL domain-containing protein (putative c-di-GMP-specific phosphodiesterase class I)
MRLVQDLRLAIEKKQLRLHFQPVVDLADGSVLKAEALVRWQHPERGMVGPGAFIQVAEETGLIAGIGDWVFCEAARWASRWSVLTGKTFQVSVNKSPLQFLAPKSLSWTDHLRSLGLPGQAIVVEITEGVLLNASSEIDRQLQSYREAGMQIAIDDFGTGYSSMAYVKKLVVDYLKIDRSFVRDMAANEDDRAIAETIILMARRLGIKVIAEGIETEEQEALLRAAGCQYGQGYLFSHPLPPEKFETLLQAGYPEPEINHAEISAQPQLIGL